MAQAQGLIRLGSSRPPRTGSIAARLGGLHQRAAVRSSRPPRTGSIAATRTAPPTRASGGRPVRQGRAPLRPRDHHRVGPGPASRPVRQGRAPLRHLAHRRDLVRPGDVVPSAKDGLHCGGPQPRVMGCSRDSRRPVRQGRAPLRLDDADRPDRRAGGRPVRQGRAPLRRGPAAAGAGASVAVVPSAKDGLHCG